MKNKIIIISALCEKNNVIGKNNKIPWHINEEYKLFKNKTLNQVVIYGRNTYESIPQKFRPLPNRINIVITRNKNLFEENENLFIFDSLEKAINYCEKNFSERKIFLCGGKRIYEEGLKICKYLYLSFIKKTYEGDVFFPEINYKNYKIISEENFDEFEFKIFEKIYQHNN